MASVAGIAVKIHSTFLLLIAWIAFSYWQMTGSLAEVGRALAFVVALFGCVLLHELGHALTAKRYGIRTRSITLLPIGGVSSMERMPDDPRQEVSIALAGPAVSAGIALFIWLLLRVIGQAGQMANFDIAQGPFLPNLMLVNLLLAGFNLLPAFPMDGGRVFRALLSMRMDPVRATRLAASVGQGLALLFALLGLLGNPLLLFIAIFIWVGAAAESGQATLHAHIAHFAARDAMLSDFERLAPDDTLGRAVSLTLAGSQKDFPVVANDRLVGVLTQADMLRGLQEGGESSPVSGIMQTEVAEVSAGEPLEMAFQRMQAEGRPLVGVLDHGRLVGIVNFDNLLELLRIRAAEQETGSPR